MSKYITVLILVFFIIAVPAGAQSTWNLSQTLGGSINPLGIDLGTQFYWKLPLSDSQDILWKSTSLKIGLQNDVTPAFERLGFFVQIEPIAIFDIKVTAAGAFYYKALSFGFLDLAGYTSEYYSPGADSIVQQDKLGFQLAVKPTFKFALGPVLFSNTFTLEYFNLGAGGFFYERNYDTVLKYQDFCIANETYLLFDLKVLLVGLAHYLMYVPGSGALSDRLSAIGIFTFTLSKNISGYVLAMAGTPFADQYNAFKLYGAVLVGFDFVL
jgi:hypothetical protein